MVQDSGMIEDCIFVTKFSLFSSEHFKFFEPIRLEQAGVDRLLNGVMCFVESATAEKLVTLGAEVEIDWQNLFGRNFHLNNDIVLSLERTKIKLSFEGID